jgi:ABC-2 type transport system permease protein
MSLNDWVISPVLQTMAQVALFLAPMLTMRLFAEEKRQGTIELLATSPVTDLQVVLGKFFSALLLFALMIVVGLLNVLLLWYYASVKPEWKPMALGALALLLFGGALIALGLFISTLTRNQIVAGIACFCLSLVMLMLGWAEDPTGGTFNKVIAYLGVMTHLNDLMKGVVALKDVAFYLSLTFFGLFLAHQSVESQRWRA